jgi:hypothetical protein
MPHARWPSLAFGSLRAACIATTALAVCLCISASASALTIAFTGTVQSATGEASLLGGSAAPGTQLVGTYEVDPSGVVGTSPFAVGPARLSFQLGGHAYDATDPAHTIALIDDRVVAPAAPPLPAITVDVWQSGVFVDADLDPATDPGGAFAGYGAQIELFDSDSAIFDGSETTPFVPADLGDFENVRLTLNTLVANGGGPPAIDGRLQVQVHIDSWTVVPVPEARSALLVAWGLVLIAVRRR